MREEESKSYDCFCLCGVHVCTCLCACACMQRLGFSVWIFIHCPLFFFPLLFETRPFMEVGATDLARPTFQQAPEFLLSQLHQCSDYRSRLAHCTFYVNQGIHVQASCLHGKHSTMSLSPTHQYDSYYRILI